MLQREWYFSLPLRSPAFPLLSLSQHRRWSNRQCFFVGRSANPLSLIGNHYHVRVDSMSQEEHG